MTTDAVSSRAEGGARTLSGAVSDQLRAAILRGDIQPGSKLRLEELRARYDVSLSPLREALSRLAAEGFVVAESQRGFRVAQVSNDNLDEVVRLRCLLEPMALAEAIARGDDVWEERIVGVFHRLSKIDRAEGRHERREEWEAIHREFHTVLISACNMPLLLQFLQTLNDLLDRYRRLFLAYHPFDRDVHAEHKEIVDAVLARDSGRASELLRQHILRTGTNLLKTMPEPPKG